VIFNYSIKTDVDENFASVMLASIIERLLRDLLRDILRHQGADQKHIDIILENNEGRARMVKLFCQLTGVSFKDALISVQQLQFHDSWEQINQSRSKFVHGGVPGELSKHHPKLIDIEVVRDNFLEAFRQLHNKFAC
jgi:hypothetical protein